MTLFAFGGEFQKLLAGQSGNPEVNVESIAVTLVCSILLSYAIAVTYRFTYCGPAYSRNFAHSIVLLGVLVSIVIAVVGNSVARAFGVFGALSIVRYRVPIKDPKDLTYVLGSVVIGLACGVGEQIEAAVATFVLIALLVLMHLAPLGLGSADDIGKKKHKHDKHDDEGDVDGSPIPTPAATTPAATTPNDDEKSHNEKKKHKKHEHEDPGA